MQLSKLLTLSYIYVSGYMHHKRVCEEHAAHKACLQSRGSGGMPPRKFLKTRFQETKFGGISANKIASSYMLTEISSKCHMLVLYVDLNITVLNRQLFQTCVFTQLANKCMQLQSLQYNFSVQFPLDSKYFQFRNSFLTSATDGMYSLWSCVHSCNKPKILVVLILAVSWMGVQNHHGVTQKRPESLTISKQKSVVNEL